MSRATHLHRLYNATTPSSTCTQDAAFVTLVANETYVEGALCLRKSLLRVGSACPLVLVVADPLPVAAMGELDAAFHPSNIRKLSDLRQRVDRYEQRLLRQRVEGVTAPLQSGLASEGASSRRMQQSESAVPIKSTRQLQRARGWAQRTHQKLLLFALQGYKRAAFLDIDMLVVRNIDALLEVAPFAAVAALPYSTRSFNSGVFVFEPSLSTAAALDDLSMRATFAKVSAPATGIDRAPASKIRISGAGERFQLSDQSILNHHFRDRWRPLPFGYNMGVKVRHAAPKLWARVELAVVHFVHRPKPWERSLAEPRSAMSRLADRMGIEPLVRAWRWHCLGGPRGNVTLPMDAPLFAGASSPLPLK